MSSGRAAGSRRRVRSGTSGGMEEHGFGGEARAEAHGAACLARLGFGEEALEDEHDGGAAHVAIEVEDVAGAVEGGGGKVEAAFYGVENGFPTGMDGPELDAGGWPGGGDLSACLLEAVADGVGDLAGEEHVEAESADLPGDE